MEEIFGKGYGHSIPLLKQGQVGGQFWAAYISCSSKEKTAVRDTLEQIDVIKRFAEKYPYTFEFSRTASDILRIHKTGKITSLIGK